MDINVKLFVVYGLFVLFLLVFLLGFVSFAYYSSYVNPDPDYNDLMENPVYCTLLIVVGPAIIFVLNLLGWLSCSTGFQAFAIFSTLKLLVPGYIFLVGFLYCNWTGVEMLWSSEFVRRLIIYLAVVPIMEYVLLCLEDL